MNRRLVVSAMGMLIAIGVLSIAGMLVSSLRMSERAKAMNIALDLPIPDRGTVTDIQGKHAKLLVVHAMSGSIFAFSVPTQDGKVAMPDFDWYRHPIYLCEDFWLSPSSPVTTDSVWECRDREVPDFWRLRWRWAADGSTIGPDKHVAPLWSIRLEVVGRHIKIHKWDVKA